MLSCPNCGRENAEDFAFCPACGSPVVPIAPAREVRRTVSVIFCDLAGSTALGERLDPESMRDVQWRYFEAMRAAIERHGGTVEKYIGDAVMAVFGIPQAHEDDALRAARAAADMRDAVPVLNEELKRDRGVTLEVRIGVNTGEVVAGDASLEQAFVTGDTVNVAARLEQHAPRGQVLIGDPTYRLLGEAVDVEPVEPLELKGKAERVPAWRLVDVREVISAVPRRLDSPIVGRERPLEQLRDAFEAVASGSGTRLVTVMAPAGVGKTRLVEEFLTRLGARATVLRGRCIAYGEGITYLPVIEAIKQAAGLSDFDPPDVIETRVCAVLEGDEYQGIVCRHITQLLGAGEGGAGEETFWAIRRFLEAVARGGPLAVVLDDIHWAEATLLDLIEHVVDRSGDSPILLLCMARPDLLDARPDWGDGRTNATRVPLEPLTDAQAATLLVNLLGSADLRADLATEVSGRIVSAAGGNPLFVEQMLAMLVDDGLVIHDGHRWVAVGDLSQVTVPPTIQALLASRLDRLAPSARAVLEAAAVVGKEFFAGAVRDMLPAQERPRVPGELQTLVRKELIRPERSTLPGEDAFAFQHQLVRDAAYDAILKSERAELHEGVADWLERVAGDAVTEQEEIVGYHLEQAFSYRTELGPITGRTEAIGARAASRLASAGRRASARGDQAAAANLLRRALATAPSDDERGRARMLLDLGRSLGWMADQWGALEAMDQGLELAGRAGDRALELLLRVETTGGRMVTDPRSVSTEERQAELEAAATAFEALGDEKALGLVWTELAQNRWNPMRFADAEPAAREAAEHARRAGDALQRSKALVMLIAAQYYGVASVEEGERTLEELSEDIARSLVLGSWATMVRGAYARMRGDLEEARRLIELGGEMARDGGIGFLVAAYHGEFSTMLAVDPAAAEDGLSTAYDITTGGGDEGHASTDLGQRARALYELGRLDEAERAATEAREMAAEDDLEPQTNTRGLQALILSARGEHVEAELLAREAVQMIMDAGAQALVFYAGTLMDLAEVLRAAGKPVEAGEAAREALALYERKGDLADAAEARRFIATLGG